MQPCGGFVDGIILNYRDDNRNPKRNENDERKDKRLHIKEKYPPRKIEYKADGVNEKGIVFFGEIACEDDGCANAH